MVALEASSTHSYCGLHGKVREATEVYKPSRADTHRKQQLLGTDRLHGGVTESSRI